MEIEVSTKDKENPQKIYEDAPIGSTRKYFDEEDDMNTTIQIEMDGVSTNATLYGEKE